MSKLTQGNLNRILRLHALWRAGNPKGRRADLRGKDLSGLSFAGADITYAYLASANCVGANFTGADCTRARVPYVNFTGANCTGANFTGSNCIRTNFTDAITTGANFTAAWCSPRNARHIGYMGNRKVYLHNTLNVVGVLSASSAHIYLNPIDVTPAEREYLQLLAATFAG